MRKREMKNCPFKSGHGVRLKQDTVSA